MNDTQLKNFKNKFVKNLETGCLEWTASKDGCGYGVFKFNGKPSRAHRLAYQTFVGPIPQGLELDHLCRNRACLNIDHLEAVTHQENMARSNAKGSKNHCAKLTQVQVDEIRLKYATGNYYQRELGEEYGVSLPSISLIVNKINWKES